MSLIFHRDDDNKASAWIAHEVHNYLRCLVRTQVMIPIVRGQGGRPRLTICVSSEIGCGEQHTLMSAFRCICCEVPAVLKWAARIQAQPLTALSWGSAAQRCQFCYTGRMGLK